LGFSRLDVIHAALALHEMKEDTSQWHDSFKKFAAFYMAERPKHNDDKLVEYTDLRAIDLAGYLQEECKDKRLGEWLEKNLVQLYKNGRPMFVWSLTDACLNIRPCRSWRFLPVMPRTVTGKCGTN